MMISNSHTPSWLTDVLRQAGLLEAGEVTAVEEHKSDAFNSQLTFLRLSYSTDAPPDLPTRFVEYWWPKMQCLVAAYRDWACEALLASAD